MCCHENCTNNCRIPIDTPAVIPATSLPALAQSLQQGPLQLNSEILSSLMGVDAAKLLGSVAVTSSQSTATSTSATPQSQGQQQSLFPCVVCYPGSSNVSLVWLPIDPSVAAAAALGQAGFPPGTTSPKLPPSTTTPSSPLPAAQALSTPSVTAATALSTPTPTSSSVDAATATSSAGQLPTNLSAAITHSYLQLLQQLQQQQQLTAQATPVKTDAPTDSTSLLPPASSLFPLPPISFSTSSADILTQAVSGSIPATSNSGPMITSATCSLPFSLSPRITIGTMTGNTQSPSTPHSSGGK